MKLYVENEQLVEDSWLGDTPLQIEQFAKENGLYFAQDDMGDCYLSKTADCECFEQIEI